MKLEELFEIIGASPNQLDKVFIQRLESRGYVVEMRGPWETVKHICSRLHISSDKFRRKMKRRPRPHPSDIDVGESGRIILIRSNPQLDRFLIGPAGLAEIQPDLNAKVLLKLIIPPPRMVRRGAKVLRKAAQIVDIASVLPQQSPGKRLKRNRKRRKKTA